MNLRIVVCVVVAVLGIFFWLSSLKPSFTKHKITERPMRPNFGAYVEESVDADTGEKSVYREITVTTKLVEQGAQGGGGRGGKGGVRAGGPPPEPIIPPTP